MDACGICFRVFTTQMMLGQLPNCRHQFCLECITRTLDQRSELENTCPLCREGFDKVQTVLKGEVVAYLTVAEERRKKRNVPVRYDFTVTCEECKTNKPKTKIIMCDSCDLGYHVSCLEKPLKKIPKGAWNCPTCSYVFSRSDKRKKESRDMKSKEEERQERISAAQQCTISKNAENSPSTSRSEMSVKSEQIAGSDSSHIFATETLCPSITEKKEASVTESSASDVNIFKPIALKKSIYEGATTAKRPKKFDPLFKDPVTLGHFRKYVFLVPNVGWVFAKNLDDVKEIMNRRAESCFMS